MGIEEMIWHWLQKLDDCYRYDTQGDIPHIIASLWYWIGVEQMINNKENK